MRRARRFWARYFVAAGILIASFAWLSWILLDVVDQELVSRRAREHREELSEAIWRLDLWLAPLLGIEAARPASDYSPTLLTSLNFLQNDIGVFEESQGYTISPLFRAPSEYFRFHFEFGRPVAAEPVSATEIVGCSPYIPSDPGQAQYLIGNGLVTEDQISWNRKLLDSTAQIFADPGLYERFDLAERRTLELLADIPSVAIAKSEAGGSEVQTDRVNPAPGERDPGLAMRQTSEWTTRAARTNYSRNPSAGSNISQQVTPPPKAVAPETPGPLVPLWVEAPARPGQRELMFLRKVTGSNGPRYQGFLVDWPHLESALLEQITDLAKTARLLPILDEAGSIAETGRMLATIPVGLSMTPRRPSLESSSLPSWSLALTWSALLIALVAFGFGFRAIIAYGEKRNRFASAVTHELRTPLTTFQLYSEMLADNMVADETKRAEYLQTLRRESRRLSAVVENVLTYARVEDGRSSVQPAELTVAELIERIRPELERRTNEVDATLTFEISAEPDVTLRTDPEAIGHIATNLVDNACKYGCSEALSEVRLRFAVDDRWLIVSVQDDGPGIPPDQRGSIFSPFERAGRESSNIPGIGLGLSLSQTIATELGGSLRYASDHSGACFELRVPRR